MPGTIKGGKQAARTNKQRYGADFYARIGRMGGMKSRTGGFAAAVVCRKENCGYSKQIYHLVRQCAGYKGGTISRKGRKY